MDGGDGFAATQIPIASQIGFIWPSNCSIAPKNATTASKIPVGTPKNTTSLFAHRGQAFCGTITASDIIRLRAHVDVGAVTLGSRRALPDNLVKVRREN